jgi:hypothetical protein
MGKGLAPLPEGEGPGVRAAVYSMSAIGPAHSKVGSATVLSNPPQISIDLGVGPQQIYRAKFLGQGGLRKQGMELAMAGGT